MPEPLNPFAAIRRRQKAPSLTQQLQDAHGRYLNQHGLTPTDFSFEQYVEGVRKDLERKGDKETAAQIRDWREQRRIAGAGGDYHLSRMATAGTLGGPSQLTEALHGLPLVGDAFDRSSEETIQESVESTLGQDAARLLTLGTLANVDTRSLGLGRYLRGAAIEGRRAIAGLPQEIRGTSESGWEMADRAQQTMRQDLVQGGVAPWLVSGTEKGGQLLGLFGATGYVNRFGDLLKSAPLAQRPLSMIGRALQNPSVNLVATEGLISEGEIRSAQLAGEDERATQLRAGQGARLANAAVFSALMPAAQWFGGIAERGLLRVLTRGSTRATFLGEAISKAPSLWLKARLGLAHLGGKAAEFQAFGLVPQVYRPFDGHKTDLSPWITTVLNPIKIAGALKGSGDDFRDWVGAASDILEHVADHWREEALAGGIVGAAGLSGDTQVGGSGKGLGRRYIEGARLGPRGLTGEERPMGARGELMTPQERVEEMAGARSRRAAREGLTPEERRSVREALAKGLENMGDERPETVQAILNYVIAGSEAQRRALQRDGRLPRDMETVPDRVRRYLEEDLGPELFSGPIKGDRPGLGVKVQVIDDPAHPNAPGRVGEVLRVIETTPPGRADPRPLRLAHVRFEDGKEGVVDLADLQLVEAPPGAMPLGIQGEGGPPVEPHQAMGQLEEVDTGRRAPGAGTSEVGKGRQERVEGRAERGELNRSSIVGAAKRMAEGWGKKEGFQDALARRFKLSEDDALGIMEELAADGALPPEAMERHNQRLVDRFYGDPGKVRVRDGNLIRTYRSLRRSFARGETGGNQNLPRLLGRMKVLWERMSPDQRSAALRSVVERQGLDFLPHERGSEVPSKGALPELLRRLGIEAPGEAPRSPQTPSEPPEPAPDAEPAIPPSGEGPRRRSTDAPSTEPGTPRGRRFTDYEPQEGDSPEVVRLKRRLRRLKFRGDVLSGKVATDPKTGLGSGRALERAQARIDADEGTHVAVIDLSGLGIDNNFRGEPGGDAALRGVGDRLRAIAKELGIEERLMFRMGDKADEFLVAGSPEAIKALQERLGDMRGADSLINRKILPDGVPYENRLIIGTGENTDAASKAMAEAKGKWSELAKKLGLETDKARVKQFANQPEGEERKPGQQTPEEGEGDTDVVEPPDDTAQSRPADEVPEGMAEIGDEVEITQEGVKERVKGRYAVVPLESVLPSHDPNASFAPREGYPQAIQPRPYDADQGEQTKVHEIAGGFDPREVINRSPRADQGPPSVAYDADLDKFVVLNGNGRQMGMEIALKDEATRNAYEDLLNEQGPSFGVDAANGGVLVRIVDLHPRTPEAKAFARYGNRPSAQPQRPIARAASEAALISDDLLESLASDPDLTPAQAINGPKGLALRRELAHKMGKAGADLFLDDLSLTEAGKEFVQNMLLVKSGLEQRLLESLSKQLRSTVSAGAAQLANLKHNPKTRAQAKRFREALAWVNRYLDGGKTRLADYVAADPLSILDTKQPLPDSLEARAMVQGIDLYGGSAKKMRDALAKLAKPYESDKQGTLLDAGEPTDLERIAEAFGLEVSDPVVALARDARQAAELGMPAMTEGAMQHHLPPDMRAERGAPDPIAEDSQAPIGNLTMPLSSTPTSEWSGKRVGQQQIIDAMERLFNVPMRTGRRAAFRRNVLGSYNTWTHMVRLRTANDIVTASHEVGHSLERRVFPEMAKDPKWNIMRQELRDAGEALYGDKEPHNGYASEGFAEFMRLYLTQPDLLAAHLPETSRWFRESFMPGDEKFADGLREIREMAKDYAEQGFHNRILSTIVKGKVGPTPMRKLRGFFTREKWIEELTPIQRLVAEAEKTGVHLPPHRDPFQLADYFRNTASARAQYWAERGMTDAAGRIVDEPLANAAAIVEQAGKKRSMSRDDVMDHFRDYLLAKRTVELAVRGIRSPNVNIRDAKTSIEHYEREMPEFLIAGKKVWRWNHNVLAYMRQLGAISGAEYKRYLRRGEHYVPLARVIPNEVSTRGLTRASDTAGPFRPLTGSGRDVRDFFPQMVANAAGLIRFAHRRVVMTRLMDLAAVPGMGRYIERVDQDYIKKAKPLAAFRDQLERAGVDLSDADMGELLTWYEPKQHPDTKDPIVPVLRPNGKVEWYQVSQDIYSALSAADAYRLPGAWDLFLGVPARLKRLGTTGLRASFSLVTNPLRDFFTMMIQSQSKNPLEIIPAWVKAQGRAVKGLFGKGGHYSEFWKAVGGEMAQPLGQDYARTFRLGEHVGRGLFGRIGADVRKGRLIQAAGDALDALRDVLQVPEAGPRLAEVEMVGKRIGHDASKWDSLRFEDALDQAIQMKRAGAQVTVDFAAAGKYARVMNAAIPFFNVAIQGPRAFLRAWKRNPAATTLIGMGITAATLQLWWKNKDEGWYQDLPWSEKFNYWHIADGDVRLRIPRPFEIGLAFATIPEAVFDSMYREDPETVRAALAQSYEVLAPDFLPVLAQEYVEQKANKDEFRNRPIVPKGEQGRPAEEQYGPSTSSVAKGLGKFMGWSPRRIDHAVEGLFGGVGRDLMRFAGQVTPSRRESQLSDLPIVGRLFAIDGVQGYSSQKVQDFFELRGNLQERRASRDTPITPPERAALRILERAAKRLRQVRDERSDAPDLATRSQLLVQMREIAESAMERAIQIIEEAGESNAEAQNLRPGGPARRLFTPAR